MFLQKTLGPFSLSLWLIVVAILHTLAAAAFCVIMTLVNILPGTKQTVPYTVRVRR